MAQLVDAGFYVFKYFCPLSVYLTNKFTQLKRVLRFPELSNIISSRITMMDKFPNLSSPIVPHKYVVYVSNMKSKGLYYVPNIFTQPLVQFDMTGIGHGDLVAMHIATLSWSDENYRYFLCIVDVLTRI